MIIKNFNVYNLKDGIFQNGHNPECNLQHYLECPEKLSESLDLKLLEALREKVADEMYASGVQTFECSTCDNNVKVHPSIEALIKWTLENIPARLQISLELLDEEYKIRSRIHQTINRN